MMENDQDQFRNYEIGKNSESKAKGLIPKAREKLKKKLRGKPHPLEDIRKGLDKKGTSERDLIGLLEEHHQYLKESIAVLMDADAETSDKVIHLGRFLHLVQMHGKAEEETLYQLLKNAPEKEARIEGDLGQDEHELAFQLGRELNEMNFEFDWSEEVDAKAQLVATLVLNHLKEEEHKKFPFAKRTFSSDKIQNLTSIYIAKCKKHFEEVIL